ncbi:hypothetical protein I4U23_000392 [Adineta vaga]|nr:hypothetical protein I4U23_000392 [Adineta vaga]
MTTSFQKRGFQSLNTRPSPNRPISLKTSSKSSHNDPIVFGRIPLSTIRSSTIPTPTSPSGVIKPIPIPEKRHSSTISLGNIFPRRKSLQTTAIATRRQSLWMNISKNAPPSSESQHSILPLRQDHSSLVRKKFLRLVLVFSYLLSISILAIALATFYGFFWSGYSTPQTTSLVDIRVTTQSLISFPSNTTSEIEHNLSQKNPS